MKLRASRFLVMVSVNGQAVEREAWADTPDLAVRMAERMEPRGLALSYEQHFDVIGQCAECSCIVKSGDRFSEHRGAILCCDCR